MGCHGMLGEEREHGKGDLAAAQFWSSPYFSPEKLLEYLTLSQPTGNLQ